MIKRQFGAVVRGRGPALAPTHHALQTQRTHQALHCAAGDLDLLAPQLPPNLASTVDTEVLLVDAQNLRQQGFVAPQPQRPSFGINLAGLGLVILRRGDR